MYTFVQPRLPPNMPGAIKKYYYPRGKPFLWIIPNVSRSAPTVPRNVNFALAKRFWNFKRYFVPTNVNFQKILWFPNFRPQHAKPWSRPIFFIILWIELRFCMRFIISSNQFGKCSCQIKLMKLNKNLFFPPQRYTCAPPWQTPNMTGLYKTLLSKKQAVSTNHFQCLTKRHFCIIRTTLNFQTPIWVRRCKFKRIRRFPDSRPQHVKHWCRSNFFIILCIELKFCRRRTISWN